MKYRKACNVTGFSGLVIEKRIYEIENAMYV